MARFIPIILAGGKGERFWPVSRLKRPKQFLCLDGGRIAHCYSAPLIGCCLCLAGTICLSLPPAHIAEGVKEQLPEMPTENILVEPQGRDTAPAVAWATIEVARRYGDDAVCGFFPADHYITDEQRYCDTLRAATDLAVSKGAITTLGITPTFASTGYGYIEQGSPSGSFDSGSVSNLLAYKVNRFAEKPDQSHCQIVPR